MLFQAEDGIRDFCLSGGLGDVYKGQIWLRVEGLGLGIEGLGMGDYHDAAGRPLPPIEALAGSVAHAAPVAGAVESHRAFGRALFGVHVLDARLNLVWCWNLGVGCLIFL